MKLGPAARQGLYPATSLFVPRGLPSSSGQARKRGLRSKSLSPCGLRRRGAICGVRAPRRCPSIACVALPCIWPRGARNATRTDFHTSLLEAWGARFAPSVGTCAIRQPRVWDASSLRVGRPLPPRAGGGWEARKDGNAQAAKATLAFPPSQAASVLRPLARGVERVRGEGGI